MMRPGATDGGRVTPSHRRARNDLGRHNSEREHPMGKDRLSKAQQDGIVDDLVTGLETLDEEEFDDLYEQLDADHQIEVDQSVREFADNAVGSEHWDSDN